MEHLSVAGAGGEQHWVSGLVPRQLCAAGTSLPGLEAVGRAFMWSARQVEAGAATLLLAGSGRC